MTAHRQAPGFYGKVPILGDFVSRRLPRQFIEPWDEWLQNSLAASREQLGQDWLSIYLTSPIWHFALSPGLCGPSAWAGVMIPSVDRVGRYFPLTVAAEIAGSYPLPLLMDTAKDWFERLETLALSALDDGFRIEAFDSALQDLPPLGESVNGAADGANANTGKLAIHVTMESGHPLPTAVLGVSGDLLQRFMPRHSVWNTVGSEQVNPGILLCEGLPPMDGFSAMLGGNWQRHGWNMHELAVSVPGPASRANYGHAGTEVAAATHEEGGWFWSSSGLSVVGKRRQVNEDAYLARPDIGLWAVADGMGGHTAGDVASRRIVDSLADIERTDHLDDLIEQVESRLDEVNRELRELSCRELGGRTIGSTVAVLMTVGGEVAVAWAGDSRVYRFRQGTLRQMTRDHSLAGAMSAAESLDRRDDRPGHYCNAITRAVGADGALRLEIARFELETGDTYLLCTDGLDKELSAADIAGILDKEGSKGSTQALINKALDRGGRDNITVVVVNVTTAAQNQA